MSSRTGLLTESTEQVTVDTQVIENKLTENQPKGGFIKILFWGLLAFVVYKFWKRKKK